MSNEIIAVQDLGISKYGDEKSFDVVSTGGGFLPRLQLFGSNSEMVKEGKFPMGHFGLVRSKETVEDLTRETIILILGWRPKAMDLNQDPILTVYDPSQEEFKRISLRGQEPDSKCMFGPEYLVYIPAVKSFATFFMASKTARREAPAVRALMGKLANLRSTLIKTKKYSWHGPEVSACSTIPDGLDDPDFLAEVKSQVEKFRNPPERELAPVEESDRPR